MQELTGSTLTTINAYLPALLALAVVLLLARLAHWLVRLRQRKSGESDKLPGQVISLVAVFLGLVAVILAIPVDTATRNQLFTLLGLVVTAIIAFSSTAFAANIMAGFMLRSMRRLRPGNFIIYEEDLGRITEIGLVQTEIQTRHRNFTYLPNTALLSERVTVINSGGTVVSAEVSLGYDLHHDAVEGELLCAAQRCNLEDPHVRVRELGDFSVTYRVAGLLTEARMFLTARSDLRKAILDCLHEAGMEIVSPGFMVQRPLPQGEAVIPVCASQKPAVNAGADSSPEDLIFDKAEEAEQQENLKDRRDELVQTLQNLKKSSGQASSDEKQRIETSLLQVQAEIEDLDNQLEKLHDESPGNKGAG